MAEDGFNQGVHRICWCFTALGEMVDVYPARKAVPCVQRVWCCDLAVNWAGGSVQGFGKPLVRTRVCTKGLEGFPKRVASVLIQGVQAVLDEQVASVCPWRALRRDRRRQKI